MPSRHKQLRRRFRPTNFDDFNRYVLLLTGNRYVCFQFRVLTCTSQTGTANSRYSSMDAGLRLGTKNTFCAQSETSIRMSRGTGLLIVASQGFSQPFLKTLAAVYPDPTDRHRLQSNQQLGTNTRQN